MKKQAAIFIITVFFSVSLCGTAMAQLDREIQILEAFYSKDDLVTAATRFPKPRSWTADNVTVITAEEIETMSAHTVADVLKYIPGVLLYSSQDFGAASLITVQGSEDRHVLVLLDGVRWNFLSGGNAETNTIPVGIIDRIETIKGPASSAWGSSLGGVINIITKAAGTTRTPSGALQVSYAEAGSLDTGAHLSGKAGPLGYYLFAGRQESGGLKKGRDFDSTHLYSKFRLQLPEDTVLTLNLGFSEPENDLGAFPSGDITQDSDNQNLFVNTAFNTRIGDTLKFIATGYVTTSELNLYSSALGLNVRGAPNEPYIENDYKETRAGGSGQLVWLLKNQTVVLGAEMLHGRLDQTNRSGSLLLEYGAPAVAQTTSSVDEWAVYVNDTLLFGKVSITPGLRFDYNTISGSFTSPSLGVTYQLATDSLIRGTVSRGFQYPPLSLSSGGGLFLDPNPDLEPEEVWSYQLGLETAALRGGLVKINFFHYRQQDFLEGVLYGGGPPAYNDIYINSGSATRHGVEVEFKAKPIFHFALSAGGAYARTESPNRAEGREIWNYSLTFEYNDKKSIRAFLRGNFADWDLPAHLGGRTDHILWDFTIQKKIVRDSKKQTTLFFTAHNLFDESQYYLADDKNPSRWVEVAVKWEF